MTRSIYVVLVVFVLVGLSWGQECKCTNERPPGTNHTCVKQAEWGKCERSYMDGYCDASCGRCDCPCVDTPPADGGATCEERASWGACEKVWMIDGYYCAKSCGFCGDGKVAETTTAVSAVATAIVEAVETKPVAEPVVATPLATPVVATPVVATPVPAPVVPTPVVAAAVKPAVVAVPAAVTVPTPTPEPVITPAAVPASDIILVPAEVPVVEVVDPIIPVDPTAPVATTAAAVTTTTAAVAAPVAVPSPVPTPAPLVRPVTTAPVVAAPVAAEECKTVYEIMSEDPDLSTSFEIWNTVRDMQAMGYDDDTTPFTIFVPINEAWTNYTFERFTTLPELLADEAMLDRLVTFHELPEPTLTTEWRHGMNLRSELRDIYNKRIIVLVGMPNGLQGDVRLLAETQALIVERDIPACAAVLMKTKDVMVPSGSRLPPLPSTTAIN